MKEYYSPIDVLNQLIETTVDVSINTFGKEMYVPWIELLEERVFSKFGYKLVVIKEDENEQ